MSTPCLLHLTLSPWSEKARWALSHHQVPHASKEYLPMVGEPALRLRLRQPRGRVTVPVLFDGDTVLRDSLDIARWAEDRGAGAPLFPREHEGDILDQVARSEAAMEDGRALATDRALGDKAALEELIPGPPPRALRAALRPISTLGAHFLAWKYGFEFKEADAHRARMRAALEGFREELGGRETLYGGLSFADIAWAQVLQFVAPVNRRYVPLSPETHRVYGDPILREGFEDLIHWRDALYGRHR